MTYPKKVMKMSELIRLGIPEPFLLRVYRDTTAGWKINPTAKNSPIVFDTDELEKERLKQVKLEKQMNQRTMVC